MYPNLATFKTVILILLRTAQTYGKHYKEINAGDLHRFIGGYPGHNNRMPVCCRAMRSLMIDGDEIVQAPPMGDGASLTIKFKLPRNIPEGNYIIVCTS